MLNYLDKNIEKKIILFNKINNEFINAIIEIRGNFKNNFKNVFGLNCVAAKRKLLYS